MNYWERFAMNLIFLLGVTLPIAVFVGWVVGTLYCFLYGRWWCLAGIYSAAVIVTALLKAVKVKV